MKQELTMPRTLSKAEIFELPVEERLLLIETLWDSIETNELPLPESHRRALDESLADYKRDPAAGSSWSDVRDELIPKG
jgi:putative addiction module component (TIGR02574 family)